MKRILPLLNTSGFLAIFLLLSMPLIGQGPDFSIELEGAPSGKVRLIGVYGNQNIAVDSANADAKGKVIFKREKPYDGGFYYIVYSDNSPIYALLDKDQIFSISTTKSNWIGDSEVEGSLDNELYYQNLRFEQKFRPRLDSVIALVKAQSFGTKEYERLEKEREKLELEKENHIKDFVKNYPNSFFTKFKSQGQNPKWRDIRKPSGEIDTLARFFTYRGEYWNGYDFLDDRLLRTPVFYNKLNNYLTTLIPQHPDSLILAVEFIMPKVEKNAEMFKFTANFIALTYKQAKLMDWEKVYSHIILKYITYEKSTWADSSSIKRTRTDASYMVKSFLGMKGENLHCPDENGVYHDLYDKKSDYTLVFIYHPDCDHCKEETPQLIKFYNEWKSKGVDVYALTSEVVDKEKWMAFNKKYQLPFTSVWDPNYADKFYLKYYVDITPELYVLDKNKIIIGKNLHVNQLEEFLTREMENAQGN